MCLIPFGGIGSTGILGAYEGYQVVCCELEPAFVALAKQNFDLHAKKLAALGCPLPVIIQGDSCRLCDLVARADCIVASPPYAATETCGNRKELEKYDRGEHRQRGGYTDNPQNLGNLKLGDIDCVISSPPYERTRVIASGIQRNETNWQVGKDLSGGKSKHYGQTEGQLGETQGDTFWAAAKTILEQCYAILKPGGAAIFVLKSFVHKHKIVDFPADWRKLCETVGFKTRHEHHAMLFKEEKFTALWGEEMIDRTNRNSFFRTLANNKAGWRTYWEIVPEDERLQWLALAKEQLPPGKRPHIVLTKAQELCFKDTAERIENWNDDVRIDYETVLCCQKQGD